MKAKKSSLSNSKQSNPNKREKVDNQSKSDCNIHTSKECKNNGIISRIIEAIKILVLGYNRYQKQKTRCELSKSTHAVTSLSIDNKLEASNDTIDNKRSIFNTNNVSIGVVVLVLVSMLSWGVQNNHQKASNDEGITIQGYQINTNRTESMMRYLMSQYPHLSKQEAKIIAIRQEIDNHVIDLEMKSIGFNPTNAAILKYELSNYSEFLNKDGTVNLLLLKKIIQANNITEDEFFQRIRRQIFTSEIDNIFNTSMTMDDQFKKNITYGMLRRYVVDMAIVPPVEVETDPTKKEILAFYKMHKDDFIIPASQNISYILDSDIEKAITVKEVMEKDVLAHYNADVRKRNKTFDIDIVIFETIQAAKASMQKNPKPKSISDIMKHKPLKATRHLIKNALLQELSHEIQYEIYNLPIKQISKIFVLDGQFAIASVLKKSYQEDSFADRKKFMQISLDKLKIQNKCIALAAMKADINGSRSIYSDLAEIAKLYKIPIRTISAQEGEKVYMRNTKKGESKIFDNAHGCGFGVMQLNSTTKSSIAPIAKVSNQIIERIKEQRSQTLTHNLAKSIMQQYKDTKNIDDIKHDKIAIKIKKGEILSKIINDFGEFNHSPTTINKPSGPFLDKSGNYGPKQSYVIMIVKNTLEANPASSLFQTIMKKNELEWIKEKQNDAKTLYMKYLYKKHKVVVTGLSENES